MPFAALGFASFDLTRAWREIETLFAGQWDDGMVPHIQFHQLDDRYFPGPNIWQGIGPVPSSGITQPPVALTFARLLYERDPEVGATLLPALLPGMRRWVDWFMTWRTFEDAIFVTHPWESGRDNAPDWDEAMAAIDPEGVGEYQRRDLQHVDAAMRPTKYDYDRYIWLVQRGARLGWDPAKMAIDPPFRVADPTMTFTLLRGVRDLDAMCALCGQPVDLAATLSRLERGAARLWNDDLGAYDSFNCATGTWSRSLSNASFLCWFGGLPAPEMVGKLNAVLEAAPYGVPSLDPRDARFDPKRYWRGPTWGMMNMLIGLGLEEQGHPEGARIRALTAKVIREFGFVEYFDPTTGQGAGGKAFTWTAAVWLAWANAQEGS